MIGIINYGLGNLSSVLNVFKRANIDAQIFSEPNKISNYSKIVLPGVGSFKAGINFLNNKGWTPVIKSYAYSGKPLLGICLGMQLLFSIGEEEGINQGLDLIPGNVKKMQLDKKLKLPHVGWNNLIIKKKHDLFNDINKDIDFYFVHSFSCIPDQDENTYAEFFYGKNFVACVGKNNIFGTQFHPEKSMPSGMILLKNFINWNV